MKKKPSPANANEEGSVNDLGAIPDGALSHGKNPLQMPLAKHLLLLLSKKKVQK